MKSFVLTVSMLAMAASVGAQQAAIDHSHVHDMQAAPAQALAAQAPAAPQAPAGGQTPTAPGGGGRGGPQIEVPWNDAIPPGTAEQAARALKESGRHGEWADVKLPDGGVLKSWVVYPERAQKAGVVLVIHDIRGWPTWPARWATSSRRTASSRSFRTSSRAKVRTAAAPTRSGRMSERPSRR